MVFERGLAREGIFERLPTVVVGIRGFAVLPVVGIILEVFAPIELFHSAQLAQFDRGVGRLGRHHLGRPFLGNRLPIAFADGACAVGLGLGLQRFGLGARLGGLVSLAIRRGLGHALVERLEHRVGIEFALHHRF